MIRRIGLGLFILSASQLIAQNIECKQNWNLVGVVQQPSTSKSSWSFGSDVTLNTEIVEMFDGTNTYTGSIFDTLKKFEAGQGYWINCSSAATISLPNGVSGSDKLIESTGWHLRGYVNNYSTMSGFLSYMSNKGYTVTEMFDGTNTYTGGIFDTLTSITSGSGYWTYVSAIDYDKFIPNALTADTSLVSITAQSDIDNKSMITAQNVSGALKFYLTTVDGNTSYKKIELSNFTVSQLSSDINSSTLNSADLAQTSGWCGAMVVNGSGSLTVTAVDSPSYMLTDTSTSYTATYATDGNLTIDGNYSKVVWSGTAIDLSGVTSCQISGMPSGITPPSGSYTPPSTPF